MKELARVDPGYVYSPYIPNLIVEFKRNEHGEMLDEALENIKGDFFMDDPDFSEEEKENFKNAIVYDPEGLLK